MTPADRTMLPSVWGCRFSLAILLVVVGTSIESFAVRAETPVPEPFEITLSVTRALPPPPPEPFVIQLSVSRALPPPPPEPFIIELSVSRSEPPPPPEPFTIELSVSREPRPPPAPFPVRVTVKRRELPLPPAPFPVQVTVVRKGLPAAPVPFPVQVTVTRRPLPQPPAPFSVQVIVVRRSPPPPPAPFPVAVTVVRRPLPQPPAPFPVQVNVIRLDVGPEVDELLAELGRVEAASAEEHRDAATSGALIEEALQRVEELLARSQEEIRAALEFLDSAEGTLAGFGSIRDAARRSEIAATEESQAVIDISTEICASDTGSGPASEDLVADLDGRMTEARANAGGVAAARNRCTRVANELRSEIRDWQDRWGSAMDGTTESVRGKIDEAEAALMEADVAAEELGLSMMRLRELEAEAQPIVEEIEERVGEWTSPMLVQVRQEALAELKQLSEPISDRVDEVLQFYDLEAGAIETAENGLDLIRADLESLDRETSRVRQANLPGLSKILGETDTAAQSAGESETRAAEALTRASSCLERIRTRIGAEETISVPDVLRKSEALAVAWIEDSGLRAFVSSGETTLDDNLVGKVARQDPAAGAPIQPADLVSLWIFTAATKPPPRENLPEMTQAVCDVDWPGTTLVRDSGGGNPRCECPSGTAWSKVSNRCLALPGSGSGLGTGSGAGRDCSHKPGTVFDGRTGRCECPLGTWVSGQRRCVDAGVDERQKAIDNARADAGCEYLLSRVRTFRSHPSSAQRQMAASAETKARTMGCDESRIKAAVAEGDRRTWPTASTGSGGTTARPGAPTLTDRQKELIRAGTVGAGGTSVKPTDSPHGQQQQQPSGDCSRCKQYSDWLETNKGPCGYHPLRLPSICELDPECVRWTKECVGTQRQLDRCMAECSG